MENQEISLHSFPAKKHAIRKLIDVFKYNSEDEFFVTWIQFFCTSFIITIPANYLILLIQNFTNGGLFIYILIIVFTYLCALPFNFFYTFIGMYTGHAYVKFWKIAPIFQGVAFSVWSMPFLDAINNLLIANFSLNYISKSLQAFIPWLNCEFANTLDTPCLNMYPLIDYEKRCCKIETKDCLRNFPFPALVYFRKIGNKSSMPIMCLNYSILLLATIVNMKKYMNPMTVLTVVFGFMLLPVAYVSIYYGQARLMPDEFDVVPKDIQMNVFYAYLFSIYRENPACIIGLGARVNPKTISIINALLAVFTVKVLLLGVLFVWQSVGILIIKNHYRIKRIECLLVNAHELYFSIIPDMMSRWHVPQIWLVVWFLLLYVWSMSSSIHLLTFNINSLINGFPELKPCRNVLCVVLITVVFVFDLSMTNDTKVVWRFANRLLLAFICQIVCITILKYGVHRIAVDYNFIYEHKLSQSWVTLIKLSVLINMTVGILSIVYLFQSQYHAIHFFVCLAIGTPIILFILWRILKYLLKKDLHLANVFDEAHDYGHRDPIMNEERIKFHAEKKTKFTADTLRCRHRCIIGIKDDHPEVKRVERRKLHLEKTYEEITAAKIQDLKKRH